MAEENKEAPAEEAKKDAPKEGADAGAPADGAKKKKGLPIFAIGLGGGGAAVIGMAYFLTVAAVQTGASVLPTLPPGEEKKVEAPAEAHAGEHGEKKAEGEGEHGEAKPEGEGHGGGGHGGEGEHGGEKPKDPAAAAPGNDGSIDIEEMQTNTKGSGQKRFISVKISVLIDAADKTAAAQLITTGRGKAAVLDALNGLLRTKSVDDLEGGGANRELLKREIREIINRIGFPKGEGRVTDVYFTRFIIQ